MADGSMGGQQAAYTFRESTRQKNRSVGNGAYSLGGNLSLELPKIGFLASIVLIFVGSITYSSASTAANYAPYSILKNVKVSLNSSSVELVNASGFELAMHNAVSRQNGRMDQSADSDYYAYPASGSAQNIRFGVEIPISLSDGINFETGLINLQAPELQANIDITFMNALTELGNNISGLTGNVYAYYKYYEIPDPTKAALPFVSLHKLISSEKSITSTGETKFEVPRGGFLLRMIHTLNIDGARSNAYDYHELKFNQTESVDRMDKAWIKFNQRRNYGYALPTGVIVKDFMRAYAQAEESDYRDTINTERLTTLDSIVYVTDGTSLGSNNNSLRTLRELVQFPVIS